MTYHHCRFTSIFPLYPLIAKGTCRSIFVLRQQAFNRLIFYHYYIKLYCTIQWKTPHRTYNVIYLLQFQCQYLNAEIGIMIYTKKDQAFPCSVLHVLYELVYATFCRWLFGINTGLSIPISHRHRFGSIPTTRTTFPLNDSIRPFFPRMQTGPEMITKSPLLILRIPFTPLPCEFLNAKSSCFGKAKYLLHLTNKQITLVGIE